MSSIASSHQVQPLQRSTESSRRLEAHVTRLPAGLLPLLPAPLPSVRRTQRTSTLPPQLLTRHPLNNRLVMDSPTGDGRTLGDPSSLYNPQQEPIVSLSSTSSAADRSRSPSAQIHSTVVLVSTYRRDGGNRSQSSPLLQLPHELISAVAENVHSREDLAILRLTCKKVASATAHAFARQFLSTLTIPYTRKGLERLLGVSRSCDFAFAPSTLCFYIDAYETSPIFDVSRAHVLSRALLKFPNLNGVSIRQGIRHGQGHSNGPVALLIEALNSTAIQLETLTLIDDCSHPSRLGTIRFAGIDRLERLSSLRTLYLQILQIYSCKFL